MTTAFQEKEKGSAAQRQQQDKKKQDSFQNYVSAPLDTTQMDQAPLLNYNLFLNGKFESEENVLGLNDGIRYESPEGIRISGQNGDEQDIRPIEYNSREEYERGLELVQDLQKNADTHAFFEFVAHFLAYEGELGRGEAPIELSKFLWNYGYELVTIKNVNLGFQYVHLENISGEGNDIIGFRGTVGESITANLDSRAVGIPQYEANKDEINALLQSIDGKVDLTGHSLGGALAQIVTADNASKVGNLYTFQAPAISEDQVKNYNDSEGEKPNVYHHIAVGDLVDNAGEESIPGVFYTHDFGLFWTTTQDIADSGIKDILKFYKIYKSVDAAHGKFLFTSSNFSNMRESGVLNDSIYQSTKGDPSGLGVGIEEVNEKSVVSAHEYYPYQEEREVAEGVRDWASDNFQDLKSKGENAQEYLNEKKEQIGEKVDDAKEKFKGKLEELKGKIFGKAVSENRDLTTEELYVINCIDNFDWSQINFANEMV